MSYEFIKNIFFSLLICEFFFDANGEPKICKSEFNECSNLLADNIINQFIISSSRRLHHVCHVNQIPYHYRSVVLFFLHIFDQTNVNSAQICSWMFLFEVCEYVYGSEIAQVPHEFCVFFASNE